MYEPLSLLNLVISIFLIIGGWIAYRQGFSRTANEVQERVIAALQSEIQALHERISALEAENTRLKQTLSTICTALKHYGIHITIDGDIVSIHDLTHHDHSYSTRIRGLDPVESPTSITAPSTIVHGNARPRRRKTARFNARKEQ